MCPMGRSKGKSRLRTILSKIEKVFDKSCDCFQEGAGASSAACLLLKPLRRALRHFAKHLRLAVARDDCQIGVSTSPAKPH